MALHNNRVDFIIVFERIVFLLHTINLNCFKERTLSLTFTILLYICYKVDIHYPIPARGDFFRLSDDFSWYAGDSSPVSTHV